MEKDSMDFFATGGSLMESGLDLNYLPAHGRGVNLSSSGQTFRLNLQTAKEVFERVEPGTIKFVLLDLSAGLIRDNADTVDWATTLEDYCKLCVENGARPVGVLLPVQQPLRKNIGAAALKNFRDTVNRVGKNFKLVFVDLIDVPLVNATATTALLAERLYFKGILSPLEICGASKDFFNVLQKNYSHERDFWSADRPLPHHIFSSMAYEDFNRLSKTLPKETCMDLMAQVFHGLTYSYLSCLADVFPKDDYNELTTRLLNMTLEKIRRKDKIKVGFYFDFSSHWCGDDLYNALAQDKRFEPVIFIPTDNWNEFTREEFSKDSKLFKARGLNVFEMNSGSLDVPKQDILFRLAPYPEWQLPAFSLANLKANETLLANIPYSFNVRRDYPSSVNYPLFHVLWKKFFPSTVLLEEHKGIDRFGMPRGVYSGYPKLDVFFKPESKFHFDWKLARPDARKIIWAPHHSIVYGVLTATFQWNYQFMYEFAKAHSEISWVVKPHPQLFWSAVNTKTFPSNEALREYFQKYNALPNAQVYTGTYYQDIFATSDGMIQDCDSFVAEYQYVDKPMIYLTRSSGAWDELGKAILDASYLVDGKDLDGIAKMIQRVFIEGDDFKAAQRKAVFDKYLNYPKANGMLAGEFIYKNIVDELKLPPR